MTRSRPAIVVAVAAVIVAVTAAVLASVGVDGSAAESPAERDARRAAAEAADVDAIWQRYADRSIVSVTLDATEPDVMADMIAHHRDAIDGSQALVGSDPEVAGMADHIIRTQQAQVDAMVAWLAEWYPDQVPTSTWVPMFTDPTNDVDYLATMIEHHHHAVVMYHTWVNAGVVRHDELGLLLRAVAKAQVAEIASMCAMLGRLSAPGGTLTAECSPP